MMHINPWIGLNPYSEGDKLYGRDDDTERFMKMLLTEHVVVLCGKSGVGKTSFIRACVCPIVREKGIIPIVVRLFPNDYDNSHISQIKQSIYETLEKLQEELFINESYPLKEGETESFRSFFERNRIVDSNGEIVRPLIILDQFEELLSLNSDLPIFKQIDEGVSYDYKDEEGQKQNPFYLLVSIREDFVSFIDRGFISKDFRINRFYLDDLNEKQAYKVITKDGKVNIDKKTAILILQSITGRRDFSLDGIPEISVSPRMLSVYLYRLYEKSLSHNQGVITEELVKSYDAINCFTYLYNEVTDKISVRAKEYFEDVLVTSDGRRNSISESDVLRSGLIKKEELSVLERHHIIKRFLYGNDIRIELTSDIFCPIVYNHSFKREGMNYRISNKKRSKSPSLSHIVRKVFLIDKNEDNSLFNNSLPKKVEYDIFISYRRKDATGNIAGRDIARGFKHYLEAKGYKCFFDYSECDDGEFEDIIIPSIRNSKFFLLIMTNGALDRCVDNGDWVRRELVEAFEHKLKIIPVAITDIEHPEISFHGNIPLLPSPLNRIEKIQWSEVSMGSLYEVSVDLMIKKRIEKEQKI